MGAGEVGVRRGFWEQGEAVLNKAPLLLRRQRPTHEVKPGVAAKGVQLACCERSGVQRHLMLQGMQAQRVVHV